MTYFDVEVCHDSVLAQMLGASPMTGQVEAEDVEIESGVYKFLDKNGVVVQTINSRYVLGVERQEGDPDD